MADAKVPFYTGTGNFHDAIAGPSGTEGLRPLVPGIAGQNGAIPADWSDPGSFEYTQCQSVTKAGTQCKMPPLKGKEFCLSHKPKE